MAGLPWTRRVVLACRGSLGCAESSCLASVAVAGSTYLAGSESLAGLRACRVTQARADLRGDAGPACLGGLCAVLSIVRAWPS